MIYSIPQSFPDEVMRIISAGIGDLGQSRGMQEIGAGAAGAAVATSTMGGMDKAGSEHIKGTLKQKAKRANDAAKAEAAKSPPQSGQHLSGAGAPSEGRTDD